MALAQLCSIIWRFSYVLFLYFSGSRAFATAALIPVVVHAALSLSTLSLSTVWPLTIHRAWIEFMADVFRLTSISSSSVPSINASRGCSSPVHDAGTKTTLTFLDLRRPSISSSRCAAKTSKMQMACISI